MLPELKLDADDGLTLYIQHESPGKDKESNWLPAPNGTFTMWMRIYWMTLCGAYTGMRLGDVSLLRWENVDLAAAELHFKTEKTNREMVIPIAEPFHRYLIDIAGNDTPRAPLFP